MEHFYTFTRVIDAPAGSFNALQHEQIRIKAHTELEAWDELQAKVCDTSDCRLCIVDDGMPPQTWSGSRPRRIAA